MDQSRWRGMCLAIGVLVGAITTPAHALPTTTKELGDVADFLLSRATCGDFLKALDSATDPAQPKREAILALLGVVYMDAYAAGTGSGPDGRALFLIDCFSSPDRLFNKNAVPH